MTTEELIDLFHKYEDLHGFEYVTNRRSNRADMHAFLLIDSLVPEAPGKKYNQNIISWAEHDEFGISVGLEELAAAGITEDQVKELRYCSVGLDDYKEGLRLFT